MITPTWTRPWAILVLILLATASPAPASAQQRDPLLRMSRTVLDLPAQAYRFESFTIDSPDRQRRWRVRLGIPMRNPAPTGGFPAFWMLDGNAALMEFDPALLAELANQSAPPLLVFVGYDNDLRIDSPARTRDYTFVSDIQRKENGQSLQVGGGADGLLEIIERQIRPAVNDRARTDPGRQVLWGHSLAGQFVLHTLYTRGGMFSTYAAGSPSLWWRNGALLGEPEQRFIAHNGGRKARVLLMLGGAERARDVNNRDMSNPRVLEHLRRVSGAPSDAAATLAQRLQRVPGLAVEYREFPGLGHGPMFRASLMATLHRLTGVADRSDTPRPTL